MHDTVLLVLAVSIAVCAAVLVIRCVVSLCQTYEQRLIARGIAELDQKCEALLAYCSSATAANFKVKKLYVSYAMRDTYLRWCRREKRFYNTMQLESGESAVSLDKNIPLIASVRVQGSNMFPILEAI